MISASLEIDHNKYELLFDINKMNRLPALYWEAVSRIDNSDVSSLIYSWLAGLYSNDVVQDLVHFGPAYENREEYDRTPSLYHFGLDHICIQYIKRPGPLCNRMLASLCQYYRYYNPCNNRFLIHSTPEMLRWL